MVVADRYFLREINERLVLETIMNEKSISRADISKRTCLNKATVSSIVANLLEKDLVIEKGIGESSGGRKPIIVTFNEKTALSLSIDLRKDSIFSILTYLDGTIVLEKKVSSLTINKRTVIKQLKDIVNYYIDHSPVTTYGIIGICVGIHGITDNNKVIFSPFYSFEDFDLAEKLENLYDIPVRLENEANLSAIGEQIHHLGTTNLVSISVHTGIGAGIILNSHLFTGASGYAGEVGHMIIVPNGKKCPCGNRGCLEQYASEQQILKYYSKKLGKKQVTFVEFKKDYFENKELATVTMNNFIRYITIGINNVMTNFNPEKIIINSKFTNEIDGVIEKIKDSLTYKINYDVMIQSSSLGDKSTLLGGSYVNSLQFLGIQYLNGNIVG